MPIQPIKAGQLPLMKSGVSEAAAEKSDQSFGKLLSDALDNVNSLQQQAAQASTDLATGKIEDVSQVVIATEKATLSLQLTIQIRNKVMDAYQEMMRMQV